MHIIQLGAISKIIISKIIIVIVNKIIIVIVNNWKTKKYNMPQKIMIIYDIKIYPKEVYLIIIWTSKLTEQC